MAKTYELRKGCWAMRLRYKGQDIYLSGYETEAALKRAAAKKRQAIDGAGKPKGLGPWRTSLGQALQDYGRERLPHMKGGKQEASRINRYLRTLGLELFKLSRRLPEEGEDAGKGPYWIVELVSCPDTRAVPKGLHTHREKQAGRTQASDRQRSLLARTMMADVASYHVQALMNAMKDEGYSPATLEQERSLLRTLFNHAQTRWLWPEPLRNPAVGLDRPEVDNKRTRVLTNAEWTLIVDVLQHAKKRRYVIPALALLLDTTMRSSELLFTARWQDVDMARCILKLKTAKAGAREVPLSPAAMAILQQLKEKAGAADPTARILPITYEALKAAWIKACRRAGIEDARIHDLRHTGTTRYALEYNGNVPLLKVITGHRTDSQLARYVNIKADDAVSTMHGKPLSDNNAPAGLNAEMLAALLGQTAEKALLPDNVVKVDFARRAA
jgi:integrase